MDRVEAGGDGYVVVRWGAAVEMAACSNCIFFVQPDLATAVFRKCVELVKHSQSAQLRGTGVVTYPMSVGPSGAKDLDRHIGQLLYFIAKYQNEVFAWIALAHEADD